MIVPKKSLGQHWLNDKTILSDIAGYANLQAGDNVVEIGPGLGSLTAVLLDMQVNLTAVELDQDLADNLKKRFAEADNLHILQQDILRLNLNELPKNYKIVANIPYYLTSNLIRILGESANPPQLAVLLVQKEVAQRVCAEPGATSVLSVTSQMFFDTILGRIVDAESFYPPPKVDSQVLILTRRTKPLFGNQDPGLVFKVVKAGFSERRKKLRSSLSGSLRITKDQADFLLKLSGIDPNLRAQNLSLDQWLALAKNFTNSQ